MPKVAQSMRFSSKTISRATKRKHLQRLAAGHFGIEIQRVPLSVIEERTTGNSHGGMIALVGARSFVPIEKLVQN